MHTVTRALVALYCALVLGVPAVALVYLENPAPIVWGTLIVLGMSIVALIAWAATSKAPSRDPRACSCDGYTLSMGGPRDPSCPVHGQATDPPAGSTGVTMGRTTGGPSDGS